MLLPFRTVMSTRVLKILELENHRRLLILKISREIKECKPTYTNYSYRS